MIIVCCSSLLCIITSLTTLESFFSYRNVCLMVSSVIFTLKNDNDLPFVSVSLLASFIGENQHEQVELPKLNLVFDVLSHQ